MFPYEFPSFKEKHPVPIFLEMWATCRVLAMGYTLALGGASNSWLETIQIPSVWVSLSLFGAEFEAGSSELLSSCSIY